MQNLERSGKTHAPSTVMAQQFPVNSDLYSVVKQLQIKYNLLVTLDVRQVALLSGSIIF